MWRFVAKQEVPGVPAPQIIPLPPLSLVGNGGSQVEERFWMKTNLTHRKLIQEHTGCNYLWCPLPAHSFGDTAGGHQSPADVALCTPEGMNNSK